MSMQFIVLHFNDFFQLLSGLLLVLFIISLISYNKIIKKNKAQLKRLVEIIDNFESRDMNIKK